MNTIDTNGQQFGGYLHRTQHCLLYSRTERMNNPHLSMVNIQTVGTKGQCKFANGKLSHQWCESTNFIYQWKIHKPFVRIDLDITISANGQCCLTIGKLSRKKMETQQIVWSSAWRTANLSRFKFVRTQDVKCALHVHLAEAVCKLTLLLQIKQ